MKPRRLSIESLESRQLLSATLTASDGVALGNFKISGDTAIATAYNANTAGPRPINAIYVFTKGASGDWSQAAKLTCGDNLTTAAIDGDTIVGVTDDGQGAIWVYSKPASGWHNMTETAEIVGPDARDGSCSVTGFGASVAISGNTIVVGAPYETTNGVPQEGTAFVYTKPATGWTSTTPFARLTASDAAPLYPSGQSVARDGYFGRLVAIDGSTVAIASCDSVYMFTKPAAGWTDTAETARISVVPAGTSSSAWGGSFTSLSLSGNTVVVIPSWNIAKGIWVYTAGSNWANTTKAVLTPNAGTPLCALSAPATARSAVIEGNTIIALTDDGGLPTYMTPNLTVSIYTEPANGWTNMTPTAEVPFPTVGATLKDIWDATSVSGNEMVIFNPNANAQDVPREDIGSVIVLPVTPKTVTKAVATLKPIVAPVITPKIVTPTTTPTVTAKKAVALTVLPKTPTKTTKAAAIVATWRTSVASNQNAAKKPTWYFSLLAR